ncbi:MAG: hypothetical protein WC974_07670 [Thermoplasmata archaeon]
MKKEDHFHKADSIKKSIERLINGHTDEDVAAVVELAYGAAQHLISYGMEKKYKLHKDTHTGMASQLRDRGEDNIAIMFEKLETYRQGRWYGGKGDGEIIKACLKIIEDIERWAKE